MKIRFPRRKPRAEEPVAEQGCTPMCNKTEAPTQTSLQEKLCEHRYKLQIELSEVDEALEFIRLFPSLEHFAQVVNRTARYL